MNLSELIVFILYLIAMLGVGFYFFFRSKNSGEKAYFLGNRAMGAWVSGLSAGASDMSAWVLMGLPASIYSFGLGKSWIAIGLMIGYALSWILVAPRLRRFSLVCGDAITIPQYLSARFLSEGKLLRILCALIFLVAYTVYAASSIKACGTLFHTVLKVNESAAMIAAALIIIAYTFLGGFQAVCWTDFIQGLLMLGALLTAPIAALFFAEAGNSVIPSGFWSLTADWRDILSGLGWGLGYFGMPHIIIRFMSIRSGREVKKAARIGIGWTFLILSFSVLVAVAAHRYLGSSSESSLIFIDMVRKLFHGPWLGLISGLLLSAILAGAMSTADSQLLAASSAFASDIYKPVIRRDKCSDREMLRAGRLVVLLIAVAALLIAIDPGSGTIMSLVENAWGLFGAAFGPVILLSLYSAGFSKAGAAAGIAAGAAADILWLIFLSKPTGIYEIVPGFIVGFICAVAVSKADKKKPAKQLEQLFADCVDFRD